MILIFVPFCYTKEKLASHTFLILFDVHFFHVFFLFLKSNLEHLEELFLRLFHLYLIKNLPPKREHITFENKCH